MIRACICLLAAGHLAAGRTPPAAGKDWPQWGGRHCRNMVSDANGLPEDFDPGEHRRGRPARPPSKNVKWTARLGTQTYGGPVIAGGRVFVGTNNGQPRDAKHKGDAGVLMCFRESDGAFLWQLVTPKLKHQKNFNGDFKGLGICATPAVDGERVYVVTNRCAVVCLDVRGLANGNDGPVTDEATLLAKPKREVIREGPDGIIVERTPGEPLALGPKDADVIWRYDMMTESSVWPQDASSCSVLIEGDYVYVGTPNGVDLSHRRVPYPDAPSLIVLDKRTGRLVAVDDAGIGPRVFHGQWSSPSAGVVNGRKLLFYGAGDGFCYAFDIAPVAAAARKVAVLKTVWKFDCNPPDYKLRDGKKIPYQRKHKARGDLSPCEVIATPAFHDGKVYVAVGQDTRHGIAPGCLSCMDASGHGDISKSGKIWACTDVDRTFTTVSVADGLVYSADYTGKVRCHQADTGKVLWTHDTRDRIWGSTFLADGKVYIGTKRGYLHVLAAGRELKLINKVRVDGSIFATPVVANGVFYVASHKQLYAVQCGAATGRAPRPAPRDYRGDPKEDKAFFNGKDLAGWLGRSEHWSVRDGQIVGRADRRVAKNQFLFSPVKVADFHLSVKVKLAPNERNSGIQFRSRRRQDGLAHGYQADVGRGVWGTLYHEHGRGGLDATHRAEKHVKPGDWNHYEILAIGPRIWLAINGHLAAAVDDPDGERDGLIAFQIHAGGPQEVRFKDIRLTHNPQVRLAGMSEQQLDAALKAPAR